MPPLYITARRWLMESASSWSWVTKTKVMPTVALQRCQLCPQVFAQLGVEGAERLVEEQHPGPQHQRPGQGHPLLLAARELAGTAPGQAGEPDELQRLAHLPLGPLLRDLRKPQPEAHVVGHRQMREQRVALEDGVDRTLLGRDDETSSPSISTRPLVGRSNPPIIRSVVVLPQPDGPSRAKNSPAAICRSTPSTASSSSKRFSSFSSVTAPPPADRSCTAGFLADRPAAGRLD